VLSAAEQAAAQRNGVELLQYCTALENGVRPGPSPDIVRMPADTNAHICWGFMTAMQAMSTLVDEGRNTTLTRTFLAPTTVLLQLIYVVTNVTWATLDCISIAG